MNAKEMAKFKKHLEDKRIELLARVRAARENEAEGASENAADLGDRALSTVTRDLSYRLSTGERDILKRIDAALDRALPRVDRQLAHSPPAGVLR